MVQIHFFLKKSKELSTKLDTLKCVHVIMGNESCDLDSMISPIVLGLFYYNIKYIYSEITVLPVMCCTSEEFALRTENIYLLNKYKINIPDLIFVDELDLRYLQKREMLKVTLVDHHLLPSKYEFLQDSIREIFDHRPIDESAKWPEDARVVIEPVGSCCTLIGREVLSEYAKCLCSAANMLYETIVFDTIGFSPEAGRSTPLDFEIAGKLESRLQITRPRSDLYAELWAAHNDVSSLTTKHLLSKDLKVVEDVYIPGLPMLVEKYLQKSDAEDAVKSFAEDQKARVLVLMGLETDGGLKRDLAVYCADTQDSLYQCILEKLLNAEFGLVEQDIGSHYVNYYSQINVKYSRKAVLPIIKQCVVSSK